VLREVRARGFATEDGEVTLGLRSVGVAVLDHTGWPAAAVAVTWPEELPRDPEHLAAELQHAAHELSRHLYGTPSSGDPV